jgi:hypothetical protein
VGEIKNNYLIITKMRLITKNVFLDTNIYEENNFFHSNNIQSLFYYSKIGVINLYLSTISEMELVNRMTKRLIEAKEDHNRLVATINKTRILKNLSTYENFDKSKITVEKSIAELTKKLDVIIESSNIKFISAENVIIEDVFKLYYKKEPPFSLTGKKYEFPDAFIIKSIDTWCKVNKKKMIFVTKDLDFDDYKSTHLIFKNDISELLSEITAYFDSRKENHYTPFIAECLKENEIDLIALIDNEIDSLIKLDCDYEKISNIKKSELRFKEYKISSIRPEYAEVTYLVELDFSFTIFPSQLDIEREIFSDNLKPKKFSKKRIIECDIEVNLKHKNDIKLKWINSNQKLFVNLDE